MNRVCPGNPHLVTSQINAGSGPPEAEAAPDAATDAWDRLAALAFDQTTAHVGCSAQAAECTCRAEHHTEHHAEENAVPAPDPEALDPAER